MNLRHTALLALVAAVAFVSLPTAGLSGPESIQAQDADARLDGQLSRLLAKIAGDQVKLARRYVSAGDIAEGIRQYRWAIHMDNDCAAAWRGLGYNQRGGEWIPGDKVLVEPEPVDESKLTGKEKEDYEKRQKEIAEIIAKIVPDENKHNEASAKALLEFHGKAVKAGEAGAELATRAAQIASWFAPGDAAVGAARGFLARHGDWVHPEIAATIDIMLKCLSDAPRGEKVDGEDPQAKDLGWSQLWRTRLESSPWYVRTTRNEERSHRLIQVIAASEAVSRAFTASTKPIVFRAGSFMYTEVGEKKQYDDFIDKYDNGDERRKEFLKRLSGTGTSTPFGRIAYSNAYSGGDDMCAHNMAATTMANLRGHSGNPWFDRGFGYMVTAQMLNTTSTRFYTVEPEGRTSVRGQKTEVQLRRDRSGPARLRRMALEMVTFDKDIPFGELAVTTVNDLTERHVAKALSLFEMLASTKADQLRAWLTRAGSNANNDFEDLLKALETDRDGLQTLWKAWVLSRY